MQLSRVVGFVRVRVGVGFCFVSAVRSTCLTRSSETKSQTQTTTASEF